MLLVIIFGTKSVARTVGETATTCPRCKIRRPCARRRVTKTFTLYFVPILSLGVLGEHLECKVCGTTFLEGDDEPAFAKATLRVMTKMLLADGVVAEEEVAAIGRIQEELTGARIDRAAIERAIAEARVDSASLHATIDAIAPRLNPAGKEKVLRAAYRVAVADGTFHEDEERLLGEIAASLEMTPRHFADVIHALDTRDAVSS